MSEGKKKSKKSICPDGVVPCCANRQHTVDDPDGLLCLEAMQITLPRCCCPRRRWGRKDG